MPNERGDVSDSKQGAKSYLLPKHVADRLQILDAIADRLEAAAIDTLIEARKRGVDVKIMVSGMNNDNWLSRQNSIRLYGRLLEARIQIYEYSRTLLHQKTMVVDGVWATVGTTNFDSRSFAHNEESNVCFYDADLDERIEDTFRHDLKSCTRIELSSWQQRGVLAKSQELVAAFLQEQV